MTGILDRSVAEEAFKLVGPMIAAYFAATGDGPNLAIVITGTSAINPPKVDRSFRDSCFFVGELGDRKTWPADLEGIALAKAAKSARTGRNSADLPPHYLLGGDTLSWGSVVLEDIVVACSGVKPWLDEMFAMWLAAAVKAICKKRFAELPTGKRFLD